MLISAYGREQALAGKGTRLIYRWYGMEYLARRIFIGLDCAAVLTVFHPASVDSELLES